MGAADCTSPAGITYFSSQDEPADQCNTVVALSWPGFFEDPEGIEVFGDGTLYFASIVDNTRNGACTTTGYMSMDEFPLYAQTSAQIQHQNEVELGNDYQLYILQSYVLDGRVYYNAVWRPQTGGSAAAPYDTGQEEDFNYAAPYLGQFNSVYDSGWGLTPFNRTSGPAGLQADLACFITGSGGKGLRLRIRSSMGSSGQPKTHSGPNTNSNSHLRTIGGCTFFKLTWLMGNCFSTPYGGSRMAPIPIRLRPHAPARPSSTSTGGHAQIT
jgi:hypothetical protein